MIVAIVSFIIVISVVIFVHEMGHCLAAKACGMRVSVFSVGMGKRLFGFNINETDYRFSLFPIGGYVKIIGLNDEGTGDPSDFSRQPRWKRAFVILSGVLANLVFAVFVGAALFAVDDNRALGLKNTSTVVGHVHNNSPASHAGIQKGDSIVSIENRLMRSWDDVHFETSMSPETPLEVSYIRRGKKETSFLSPIKYGKYNLGITGMEPDFSLASEPVRMSPGKSIIEGFMFTVSLTGQTFLGVKKMVFGYISPKDALSGPIEIASISGEMAKRGLYDLLVFLIIINVAIAVVNILPIPVLDGGHFSILLIEGVCGKDLTNRTKGFLNRFGLILILTLFFFVLMFDLVRNVPLWLESFIPFF